MDLCKEERIKRNKKEMKQTVLYEFVKWMEINNIWSWIFKLYEIFGKIISPKRTTILKTEWWMYEPGGVGPMRSASPDGDASCDGSALAIDEVARSGGCVARQYA